MSGPLKPGVRVRVTTRSRLAGPQPGDTGTVLRVGKLVTTGSPYCTVAMDKAEPDSTGVVFAEDEIEPDT
jgi:hypothetical protein